mmetsp:Transcript_12629/g.29059  ORF Transcript_12629/g.29059 Transcript_12629/m.29059 type:complete len:124 (-) Transcript_12629:2070-2441(-)
MSIEFKTTLKPTYCYMRLHLSIENIPSTFLDLRMYKSVALSAIREMYGDVGLPGTVDAIEMMDDKSAIMRVPFEKATELRNALVFKSKFDGNECVVRVIKVAGNLISVQSSGCFDESEFQTKE